MDLIGKINPDPCCQALLQKLKTKLAERTNPGQQGKDGNQPEALIHRIAAENLHPRHPVTQASPHQGSHQPGDHRHRGKIHKAWNDRGSDHPLQLAESLRWQVGHQCAQLSIGSAPGEQIQSPGWPITR